MRRRSAGAIASWMLTGAVMLAAAPQLPAAASATAVTEAVPAAQSEQKPAPEPPSPVVPLKVTVVISRLQGEKKVSSLPFTLTLNSNGRTSLRMGADVPIPQANMKEGTSYQYRSVGTNIDCGASPMGDGRFALSLTVSDTQVSIEDSPGSGPMRGLPRFQNFTSTATLALRDAQTMQYTAATDKVTGEVVRVDVTLNVVK